MGTFVTTDRMNPALRARVERSVSRRARAVHNAARLGFDGPFASGGRLRLAWLFPFSVAVLVIVLGTWGYIRDRRAVEADRQALLSSIADARAKMPKGYEGFVPATDRSIVEIAKSGGAADVVDPVLRAPGALDALLRRPAVYVRGSVAELDDAAKIDSAARGSSKDAFLVCLLAPPTSSSERDLLAKVRGVYFGGAKVDAETANVRRLSEARIGLALLTPAFETTARTAPDRPSLARLKKELSAVPIGETAKAATAELVIVVADIPHGEARVALVDLAANKVLFNARRRFEEQGNSAMASLHRADLESCSLALAVRRAMTP